MKNEFSRSWNASTQPRKQRKYRYNAPAHLRRVMLGAQLDKPLRERFGRRSAAVRRGDTVKVMRGSFKGKQGTVDSVSYVQMLIYVSGCERTRVKGRNAKVGIDPSNVRIIALAGTDKKRTAALERSKKKVPSDT